MSAHVFGVGDRVEFKRVNGGYLVGIVVAVVPAGGSAAYWWDRVRRLTRAGERWVKRFTFVMPREHQSYLVADGPAVFWPNVARMKRLKVSKTA